MQTQVKTRKIEKELRPAEIQAQVQTRKLARDREITLAETVAKILNKAEITETPVSFTKFTLARQTQLSHQFNEDDPKSFRRNFEKTAAQLEWTKSHGRG